LSGYSAPLGATVDAAPPDTHILNEQPVDGALINYDAVSFDWLGTDLSTPAEQIQYAYKLDADPWTGFGAATSHLFAGLAEGPHQFYVKARNLSSVEDPTPASRSFVVDTVAPAFDVPPTADAAVYGNGETIQVTIDLDSEADISASFGAIDSEYNPANVTVTETDPANHGYTASYPISLTNSYPDSEYAVILVVRDAADNTRTDSTLQVRLDNEDPTIVTRTPEPSEIVSSTTDISITFSEPMDQASVADAFSLEPPTPGSVEWSGRTFVFSPTNELLCDTQYTATVSASAVDMVGKPLAPETWSFRTAECGPRIVHYPVSVVFQNTAVPISASVTSNTSPFTVTLHYRVTGDPDFTELPMTNTTDDVYAATIPAAAVTTAGVDYYIQATDGHKTRTHPRTGHHYIYVGDVCHSLTLDHTGLGTDPVATPANTLGCPAGQYVVGEQVRLSGAVADAGWHIASWTGTDNDASTSANNTLTMPASDHTALVNYEEDPPPCYVLTLTHTGSGTDPVANPGNSATCPAGSYYPDELIQLTADPDPGWIVSGWSGTDQDTTSSLTNELTMPAGDHTATVHYAQGLQVDSTADAVDANPGDGACATLANECTLRAAIQEANSLAGLDTVAVPAGLYTLALAGADEDAAATGDLDISDALSLIGEGAPTTLIDGNAIDRVFEIWQTGVEVEISALTVQHGNVPDIGGGILNRGVLTLNGTRVFSNAAVSGAGIFHGGTVTDYPLTLVGSTVDHNTGTGLGGGIAGFQSSITLSDTVVANNTAQKGGGVYIDNSRATLSLTGTTISDNSADDGGGVYVLGSSVVMEDSDLAGNEALIHGGGIFCADGSIIVNGHTAIGVSGDGNAADSNTDNYGLGGGIYLEDGSLSMTGFGNAIAGNSAAGGGGIANYYGPSTIENTAIVDNSVHFVSGGGGIFSRAPMTLTNVTLSGNMSTYGGAIRTYGATADMHLRNVTISDNTALYDGSDGISHAAESVHTLENTIIGDNNGGNCAGDATIVSLGHNLDSDGSCGLGDPTDITGVSPLLGPLQDNGGSTLTHALQPGSPAIDAGDNGVCPATDQRGESRPQDGDADGNSDCDVGAYEAPSLQSNEVALLAGWNLLALPLAPLPDAAAALAEIEAQGGDASEIYRWQAGNWDGHFRALPGFNNFPLELGRGYFVKSTMESTWQRTGLPPTMPVPVTLTPGWTLIGLPKLPGPMQVADLLAEITTQGGDCSEVYRWVGGNWDGHFLALPGYNNFWLTEYEGYFVKCANAITYVPGGVVARQQP
jgi:CSLREA domain-containing protein